MMWTVETTEMSTYDIDEPEIAPVKEEIGTRAWRARRATSRFLGRALASGLKLSAASGAAMLLASKLRSGSPWTGVNALATVIRRGPRRAKRFDRTAAVAGAAVLAAGVFVVASLYQGARSITGGRLRRLT
jgi:hypothetical protein